jgi:hypothetical protein
VFEQCLSVFEACNRVIIAADLYTGTIDPEKDLQNPDQSKLAAVEAQDLDIRDLMEFSNSTMSRSTEATTTSNGTRDQEPGAKAHNDLVGSPDEWAIDNTLGSGSGGSQQVDHGASSSSTPSTMKNAYTPQQAPTQSRQTDSKQQVNNEDDLLGQGQGQGENGTTPAESVDSENLLAEVDRTLDEDRNQ